MKDKKNFFDLAFKDRLFAVLSFSSDATQVGMWLLFIYLSGENTPISSVYQIVELDQSLWLASGKDWNDEKNEEIIN